MRIGRQLPAYLLLVAAFASVLLLTLRFYQEEPITAPAQLQLPGPQTFIETFDSTTYRDINYSTALWDTSAGTISVPGNRATAQALSLAIDKVSDDIQSATLTFTSASSAGNVAFYLSNDNGVTYEPTTPGQKHVFTSSDSKLKWKAELTKSGNVVSGESPAIDSVTVAYEIKTPDHLLTIQSVDPIHLAIEVSKELYPDDGSAGEVLLGRSDDVIDSFVATPLAVQSKAPILFTQSDQLDPATAAEMARVLGNRAKTVRVLGGETAIGNGVIGDLFAQGFGNVERIGGKTRYETAQQIAEKLIAQDPESAEQGYLTEARVLADAFSASAPAGAGAASQSSDGSDARQIGSAHPILLTERNAKSANAATKEVLRAHQPQSLIVVGGPASITDAAVSDLTANTGITPDRQFGLDRFGTNAVIAQEHFASPKAVVVVAGQPTVDTLQSAYERLLGGLVAATKGAPLIFAKRDGLAPEVVQYLYDRAASINQGLLIGPLENPDTSTQLYNLISHD